ncbi:unnamed protein product [Dicrocoelium dendriticum]|nr:unnamed protein product [Dicrocoelium dendriticum]
MYPNATPPTMQHPLLMRVLASSVHLAGRACTIVRNILASNDLEIVEKGVNDLQSKADRDAQRFIVGSLTRAFPDLKIIGEEGDLEDDGQSISLDLDEEVLHKKCPPTLFSTPSSEIVVWVDPLDGTKEFTEGLVEHVTVLIGIAVSGRPVAGVIAQPFYSTGEAHPPIPSETKSRVFWSLDGLGVFGITPNLPPGPTPFPMNTHLQQGDVPNILVVTRSHPTPNLQAAIEACAPTKVIRTGGCGYKVVMLLEGLAHLYLFPSGGTKRWDTCAPEAVLSAAGGRMTDLLGQPYDYRETDDPVNHRGLLATPVADWLPIYASRIPRSVVDSMRPS